jgi:DHA1 family tetracycline resistance protein-like MFS transporter
VFVLYAALRNGWGPLEVGVLLALVGVLDMIVQGLVVGRAVARFGDRSVMVFGLFGGAVGICLMGLAPGGVLFTLAMFPNALWGLAMPTLQSLMTRRVGESEQGQLQGANMSVASIAGVASPLFFGALYTATASETAAIFLPGASFVVAAAVLLAAAILGWSVARRAARHEAPV